MSPFTIISFLLLSFLAITTHAAVVTYNLDIGYIEKINPDGNHERRVIGVNGKWPPPKIEANFNDTLVLNVHNSLDVPTSLHSHGMFQNTTNYFDGAAGITQCGIPPGATFTYEFPLRQSGTYWYHAHSKGQYLDGFRGPLIIHPPAEPHKYDAEYTLILHDWYHKEYDQIFKDYFGIRNPTGIEPPPDSALALVMNGTNYVDKMTFTPGKTYRVRIINMSGFAMFHVALSGHPMEVIEVDGVDTERKKTDGFWIGVAQRWSVLVTAKNTTDTNYQWNFIVDDSMFAIIPETLKLNFTSPIEYSATAKLDSTDPPYEELKDTDLAPLQPIPSVKPDVTHELNIFLSILSDGLNHGMFNNVTYLQPKVPSMYTALTMGADATKTEVYGKHSNPVVLEHNKMVEVVINNDDGGSHPFHLHGHTFQILNISDTRFDPSIPLPEHPNPIRRDTIQIPAQGSAVIRFRADNPGVWVFHCHIQWHMDAGLVATFIEAPLQMQERVKVPQFIGEQCGVLGVKTKGNAAGGEGMDLSGEVVGPAALTGSFDGRGVGALVGCILSAVVGFGVIVWFARE